MVGSFNKVSDLHGLVFEKSSGEVRVSSGSSPSPSMTPPSTGSSSSPSGFMFNIPQQQGGFLEGGTVGSEVSYDSSYGLNSSVYGRSVSFGYSRVGFKRLNLRKLVLRVEAIQKRLVSPNLSANERVRLRRELSRLLAQAGPLVKMLKKWRVVYGDYHAVYVPDGYRYLVDALGLGNISASVFVDVGRLYVEFDDGSSDVFEIAYVSKVFASKYHPLRAIQKGSQEARRVLNDLLALASVLDGVMVSPRGDRLTTHNVLSAREVILTVPKDLSWKIWYSLLNGDASLYLAFKRAGSRTIRRFIRYLADREVNGGLSSKGGRGKKKLLSLSAVVDGFVENVHPVGDRNPFEPHFHYQAFVPLVVFDKVNKRWYRLNPMWGLPVIRKLKEIWHEELVRAFGDELVPDNPNKLNVWVGDSYYNLPDDADAVFFVLKYASRKLFTAFSEYYSKNAFNLGELRGREEFVKFVFAYSNRTERYGFLRDVWRYIGLTIVDKLRLEISKLEEERSNLHMDLEFVSDDDVRGEIEARLSKVNERLSKFVDAYERVIPLMEELERISADDKEVRKRLVSELKTVSSAVVGLLRESSDDASGDLGYRDIVRKRILRFVGALFEVKGKHVVNYAFDIDEYELSIGVYLDRIASYVDRPPPMLLIGDRGRVVRLFMMEHSGWV